jgi:hypothetical protein
MYLMCDLSGEQTVTPISLLVENVRKRLAVNKQATQQLIWRDSVSRK